MPLTSKTFSQLIDFTRTSAATYVDQTGRIVPTPVSPNIFTFTQEFGDAAWTKTAITVTTDSAVAPDGTTTADKVVATATSGYHAARQTFTATAAPHVFSVYVKAAEYTRVHLGNLTTASGGASFDLTSGTLISTYDSVLSTSIIPVGNGWYRCSIAFAGQAASWSYGVIGYPAGATLNSLGAQYTGDGTSGIFVWGAQLEQTPDANLTLGSELVTNGDFAGGPTGWTLDTGITVTSNQLVGATNSNQHLRQSIGSVGSRVYRVSMTVVSYTSGSPFITIGAGTQAYIPSPSVTGTKTFYVVAGGSDALFRFYPGEFGIGGTITVDNISVREVTAASPSTYTRNFGGRFPPRFDYDPVTLAPRGLLIEEQRTNLLLRSEEFDNAAWAKLRATVTANSTTSPDGTVDADTFLDTAVAGTHALIQTITKAASAITYAATVYAKQSTLSKGELRVSDQAGNGVRATFDLAAGTAGAATAFGTGFTAVSAAISPAGAGWFRVTLIATSNSATTLGHEVYLADGSANTSYTGTGAGVFVWGAQLEAGAFATSYIPTTTSQVTRTADSAAITGANFSSWYNPSEGTFLVEYIPYSTTTQAAVFAVNDFTSNNRIDYRTVFTGIVTVGGAAQAVLLPASSTPSGAIHRIGIAYKADDFAASANGGAVTTDNSGTLPAVNRLLIGAIDSGALPLNGYIRSIRYYPTRLTNAQLQALTA